MNLLTGAFEYEWTFPQISNFSLIYNSRSLNTGLFGLSWCTPLDSELVVVSKQQFQLRVCDREFDIEKTQMQSTGASLSLKFRGMAYIFNKKYKLTGWQKIGGVKWIVTRNFRGEPIQLRSDKGHILQLGFRNNKVESLRIKNSTAQYHFSYDQQKLRMIKSNQNQYARFDYDTFDNIVKVDATKHKYALQYKNHSDLIRSLKHASGCQYDFDFLLQPPLYRIQLKTNKCFAKDGDYQIWMDRAGRIHEIVSRDRLRYQFRYRNSKSRIPASINFVKNSDILFSIDPLTQSTWNVPGTLSAQEVNDITRTFRQTLAVLRGQEGA